MADEKKPAARKLKSVYTAPNEMVPGGRFIQGGRAASDGKHYGGRVVNAEGQVLHAYGDDEVNDGTIPADHDK